jgi:hypothetical protein
MPKTDSDLAGILIIDTDSSGYIVECTTRGGLLTTAGKFAIGCKMTDVNDLGKLYINRGTVAVPSWEDASLTRTVEVSLTAAQIIALYTKSVEIIPAVSGKVIVLDNFVFDLTGTATQFTGGGAVNLQYDDTAHGAGTTLHADIAASVVTGATGRVLTVRTPKDLSAVATASITGKGVYIGAKTAVFADGTGTAKCKVSYHLV